MPIGANETKPAAGNAEREGMVCALRSRVLAACSGGSVNDESQGAGVEGGAARRRLFSRPVRYGAAFGDMCICSYGCPSEISNLRYARPAGHRLISAKIVQFLYLIGMRSLIFYVFCRVVFAVKVTLDCTLFHVWISLVRTRHCNERQLELVRSSEPSKFFV